MDEKEKLDIVAKVGADAGFQLGFIHAIKLIRQIGANMYEEAPGITRIAYDIADGLERIADEERAAMMKHIVLDVALDD